MSRFTDYDDDDENWALNMGRWQHNYRAALKGKRGRKVLTDLREALMALPQKRLIGSALCTVGGVDKLLPPMSAGEMAATKAQAMESFGDRAKLAEAHAERMRQFRDEGRKALAQVVEQQGEGVCAIGAYLWHQKVKKGADPAEAFGDLPLIFDGDEDGDPLNATAESAQAAGMAFTLAYELAYRNDERFRDMTPEARHAAFVAWIDQELAKPAEASS